MKRRARKSSSRSFADARLSLDDVAAALDAPHADLLARVARHAARLDRRLYLVGGPVRDLLLGRPLADLDLMVEGDAAALGDALTAGRAGARLTLERHPRFGTLRIRSDASPGDAASVGAVVDLAGMRHETYAAPGSLPDVTPGTVEQDVARRDFSVNALLCPLDGNDSARAQPILDLVGGLEDLARRRLRILHPESFHDDPTRAFRAARFAARLAFSLDRSSRNALRNALRDGAFGAVSGERFRRELQLVFDEARQGVSVGKVLRSLSDWHVLAALEPGLSLPSDRLRPLRFLSQRIARPDWPTPRWRGWVAGLSVWLAPLPAAQRRRTLERFSIRGEQATRIVHFGRDADRTLKSLARARGRGAVDALLGELPEETIQALYALATIPVRRRILRWGGEDRRRRAPISGAELTELGLVGPDVGKALRRIRAGFLDGEVANREEAIALAQEIARRASRRVSSARAGSKRGRPRARARQKTSARTSAEPVADESPKVAPGDTIADTARRRKAARPDVPVEAGDEAGSGRRRARPSRKSRTPRE